jgi:hypothetical protein
MESIVVTGSRVIVNGDNSPTPVTAVRVQDILACSLPRSPTP